MKLCDIDSILADSEIPVKITGQEDLINTHYLRCVDNPTGDGLEDDSLASLLCPTGATCEKRTLAIQAIDEDVIDNPLNVYVGKCSLNSAIPN